MLRMHIAGSLRTTFERRLDIVISEQLLRDWET